MNEEQIEDLFDFYGYADLYKRFKTPLFVSGLFEDVEAEQVENFFDHFSFDDRQPIFNEFRYWFQVFLVTNKH
ncbi:hypothetical protein JOC86_004528 [Bacillus pakistanensis]|uniref:Uncharacterized protein n=1 Tax=Rossellomorea pakistanensis TaxID=992288 RepID=A0ABS2NJB9_9BACI|nr:hypothetical protein [Bacillus pakistanensis]MBM7587953.1 hypothetical protein [Bacillus pakistanensis]